MREKLWVKARSRWGFRFSPENRPCVKKLPRSAIVSELQKQRVRRRRGFAGSDACRSRALVGAWGSHEQGPPTSGKACRSRGFTGAEISCDQLARRSRGFLGTAGLVAGARLRAWKVSVAADPLKATTHRKSQRISSLSPAPEAASSLYLLKVF